MSSWKPEVITDLDSAAAQSVEINLASAQPRCNFVVFAPRDLPAWMAEYRTILRPECVPGRPAHLVTTRTPWSPANSATLRTEYVTTSGGKFRVKQFLYDWARPAADHPCLWGSKVTPHPLKNGHVVWLGTDYMKHHGASATIQRTSVELSVLEGELTDGQIVEFYAALCAVDDNFALILNREPMARLSYWARHRPGLINVPVGLWQYHRKDLKEEYDWSSTKSGLPTKEAAFVTFARDVHFEFDSVGIFHSTQGVESEVIYTSGPQKAREIRAVIQRGECGRILIKREPHPASFEEFQMGSFAVHLGYVSTDYGPFDAVIEDSKSGVRALVMTSSAVGHSKEWYLDDVLPSLCFA